MYSSYAQYVNAKSHAVKKMRMFQTFYLLCDQRLRACYIYKVLTLSTTNQCALIMHRKKAKKRVPQKIQFALSHLVVLEGENFSGDARLSDDLDLHAVSGVDVTLSGDHKDLLHDGHHLLGSEGLLLVQPVLVANLSSKENERKRLITEQDKIHKKWDKT